jgi:hypothetical protein
MSNKAEIAGELQKDIAEAASKKKGLIGKGLEAILPKKVLPYIPFAGAAGPETEIAGLKGMQGGKFFDKQLLSSSLRRGSRFAIGGAALMYGLNKLLSKKQQGGPQNVQGSIPQR